MTGMTDRELIERFTAGRETGGDAAFAVLVARHGPTVLGVCRHLLGDDHAADDAFQAVFLVLARRAGSIRRPELLGPWLHGVAVRIARKSRARAERRRRREQSDPEGTMLNAEAGDEPADARMSRDEEAAAVHEEIGRLPERYRRAVVLCHFEGLTHADAARRLGCAPGTIGSLVSRARELLRSRLARRGLSAGAPGLVGSLRPRMAEAAVPRALERATIRAALAYAKGPAVVAGIASATAVELAGGALEMMTLSKLAAAGMMVLVIGAVATGAVGLAAGSLRPDDPRPARAPVREQAREQSVRLPAPSLPGAVTRPPQWLDRNMPFDSSGFFAAPPPEENAASRYLEALFEFGPEMEICFPEGPDRESRKRAAERRNTRLFGATQALRNAPNSVSEAEVDARLAEYDTGFRKLDWAQQRPRCVFETGIGATARIPHTVAAGHVARVGRLKVCRELDRGEIEAAIRDLARLLRLARDLRPRGVMITDIASASLERTAVGEVIMPILAAPRLTVAHCDRILALLVEHETRSIDAYSEGLRAEYLSERATLHDLVFEQERLRKEWASFGNPPGASIVAEVAEPVVHAVATRPLPRLGRAPGLPGLKALAERMIVPLRDIPDLDARIARMTPDELSKQVEMLNELYRGWLSVADAPYLERIRKSFAWQQSLVAADLHTRLTRGLMPATTAFVRTVARSISLCRAAEGLLLVRRWQLRHGGDLPPSLEAAAREAGRPSVPVDPYDGRPIRFAVVDGQATVYAVGQDGRDDGGRIDNARTPDSGDVLLRLPRP
jgi:RNA polymerase sigma factor (sigma-70 family)